MLNVLTRYLDTETTRDDARLVLTIRGIQMHFSPVAFLLGSVDGQS